MIDFALPPEIEQLRDNVRAFRRPPPKVTLPTSVRDPCQAQRQLPLLFQVGLAQDHHALRLR